MEEEPSHDYYNLSEEKRGPNLQEKNRFDASYLALTQIIESVAKESGISKTHALKILLECVCDYRARHEITFHSRQDFKNLDPFYSMKHDCEKSMLVNKLAHSLAQKGIHADIELESKHMAGVLDIQITFTAKSSANTNNKPKTIAVEWKSGNTFSLFQLIRYLLECDVLILVRSQKNQVICFKRNEVVEFLIQMSSFLQDRVKRLRIDHSPQKIPGPQCVGCPVGYCGHCRPPLNHTSSVTEEYIKSSIISSLDCIDSSIVRVIDIVMKEQDLV